MSNTGEPKTLRDKLVCFGMKFDGTVKMTDEMISEINQWAKQVALECLSHENCKGKASCWDCTTMKVKIEKSFGRKE